MKLNGIFGLIFLFVFSISCQESGYSNEDIQELLSEKKFREASDIILLQKNEELDELNTLRAAQFFSERTSYDISQSLLEKLLVVNPKNIPGRLLLANNLRNTKSDDNRAIAIYNELADIDSVRFIVLPERARLYIRIDEVAKAENDIAEAKSLQPKYFASYLADGLLQYSQGLMEQALDLLEIAEDLDPGVSSEASLYAGYILLTNNINYDALGKFTKAIDVGKNINMGYAFINRGVCQINLQDTSFACQDWDSGYYYMPEKAQTYLDDYCIKK